MIKDCHAIKTKNKEIIEVLIGDSAKVWIPIMGTSLYLIDREGELNKVQEVRVRYLYEEE